MNETEDLSHGRKLLTAVERILADNEAIVEVVAKAQQKAGIVRCTSDFDYVKVADLIVNNYAKNTAISGGASALPAIVPGVGTVAALTGGTLADVAFLLKFEVEMSLALCHLYGFDIGDEAQRRTALLLASVGTYDAKSGGNVLVDIGKAQGTAIWNYGPRQASKLLLVVLTRLALAAAGKGFLRAIPLVGVAVGASVNLVLTQRVGERIRDQLQERRELGEGPVEDERGGPIVDAFVVED